MQAEIRAFPSGDGAFVAEVERALADAARMGAAPASVLASAIEQLRRLYPNATARSREELGALGTLEPVWYFYRDGRIRRDDAQRERLYGALARARSAIAESRRVLEGSADALRTVGRRNGGGTVSSRPDRPVKRSRPRGGSPPS